MPIAVVSQTGRDAIQIEDSISAGVPRLLSRGCPPAVPWLIVAIVVGVSINRHFDGALAHVRQEVLERQPTFAN